MNKKNTELRNYWENHIHQWLQSGKSQTEYCNEHNLAIKSFGYWKLKIIKSKNNNQLIEIKKTVKHSPSQFIELISPEGIVVRFRDDISTNCLKNIVTILRS